MQAVGNVNPIIGLYVSGMGGGQNTGRLFYKFVKLTLLVWALRPQKEFLKTPSDPPHTHYRSVLLYASLSGRRVRHAQVLWQYRRIPAGSRSTTPPVFGDWIWINFYFDVSTATNRRIEFTGPASLWGWTHAIRMPSCLSMEGRSAFLPFFVWVSFFFPTTPTRGGHTYPHFTIKQRTQWTLGAQTCKKVQLIVTSKNTSTALLVSGTHDVRTHTLVHAPILLKGWHFRRRCHYYLTRTQRLSFCAYRVGSHWFTFRLVRKRVSGRASMPPSRKKRGTLGITRWRKALHAFIV